MFGNPGWFVAATRKAEREYETMQAVSEPKPSLCVIIGAEETSVYKIKSLNTLTATQCDILTMAQKKLRQVHVWAELLFASPNEASILDANCENREDVFANTFCWNNRLAPDLFELVYNGDGADTYPAEILQETAFERVFLFDNFRPSSTERKK